MRSNSKYTPAGPAKRCPICEGKFGLVRHYSWRTALCSKKCADHLRARAECDRRWLRWFQPAWASHDEFEKFGIPGQ
jgi:hypothetical protein